MFCGKCGMQNEDGAEFCAGCGTRFDNGQSVSEPVVQSGAPSSTDNNRKIGIIAVAAAGVVLLLLLVLVFSGRGWKKTVKQYMNAMFKGDVKKIVKLIPDKVIDEAMDEEGWDKDDFNDEIKDLSKEIQDTYEWLEELYDGKLKLSYEIDDVDDIKGDELEDLQDHYDDEYDVKVSAAKLVEIEMTMKVGKEKETTDMELQLIKVGRSWYIDVENSDDIF